MRGKLNPATRYPQVIHKIFGNSLILEHFLLKFRKIPSQVLVFIGSMLAWRSRAIFPPGHRTLVLFNEH